MAAAKRTKRPLSDAELLDALRARLSRCEGWAYEGNLSTDEYRAEITIRLTRAVSGDLRARQFAAAHALLEREPRHAECGESSCHHPSRVAVCYRPGLFLYYPHHTDGRPSALGKEGPEPFCAAFRCGVHADKHTIPAEDLLCVIDLAEYNVKRARARLQRQREEAERKAAIEYRAQHCVCGRCWLGNPAHPERDAVKRFERVEVTGGRSARERPIEHHEHHVCRTELPRGFYPLTAVP